MKKLTIRIFAFLLVIGMVGCSNEKDRILVFSKTAGFRHASIEPGIEALKKLTAQMDIEADFTEDAEAFTEQNLKQYKAVVFLSTTMDVLNHYQEADFERFIQAGGGYMGIHAAADTEYDWEWYGGLVGGYFKSHPPGVHEAKMDVLDASHPSTDSLPAVWMKTDEWYNYYNLQDDLHVLINLDESSYEGGENGENHPIAWYHEYDGGRAFYTGMGHTDESFVDPLFLSHLRGGLEYVLGGGKLNYANAVSMRVPEENRFTKVVLADSLDEPTEMAIMKDQTILFTQRKGEIFKYDPVSGEVSMINKLDVYTEQEDGLMGITLDPDFENNHWVYLYYSPVGDEPKQNLSRFEYKDGKIDLESEIIMLEVKTQREECCHTGGSLTWDRAGNLYLSTGDDTNPFESDGYGPIDERPGRAAFDGQRTSANANDLRGKVLRIHPEQDGTYTIPDGNLFPVGTEGTRPEVYVMGARNPYRISVDQRTGYLYWGDVGPDASEDSVGRGPKGHDEVNQAKEPGNYGYPQFIGNNKPYIKYDFATQESGAPFDASAPLNTSPNNTGIQQLPPAQPAFIWYPYGESEEFPQVGSGGRNAMAGPVYYSEDYPNRADNALPPYFDGKLIVYDWIRGWIFAVTMDEAGDFVSMEPFMSETKFNNPIEMEMASNGVMYMLEYGTGWFSKNPDARLVRIDYNGGNRVPVAIASADAPNGSTPHSVRFNGEKSYDYDGDELDITWDFGDGQTSSEANPSHTYESPGTYMATLTVSDGNEASTSTVDIIAGNDPASISIDIIGNQTFYWKNTPVMYKVSVADKEDGSTEDGGIPGDDVFVGIDVVAGAVDESTLAMGHQLPPGIVEGKQLIDGSDCLACHKVSGASIGPDYLSVANKYKEEGDAIAYLSQKIINGGSGVWGDVAMSAHPQMTTAEASKIAEYILALGQESRAGLPARGEYKVEAKKATPGSSLLLRASYADKGNQSVPSILVDDARVLKSSMQGGELVSDGEKFQTMVFDGQTIQMVENEGTLKIESIDLLGVKSIKIMGVLIGSNTHCDVKVHIDGQEVGVGTFKKLGPGPQPDTFLSVAQVATYQEKNGTLSFGFTSNTKEGPAIAITSFEFQK